MNTKALYDSLHPLEIHLLAALFSESTALSDAKLVELTPLDPSQISMALGWLQAKQFIQIESETSTFLVGLTGVGRGYLSNGSPAEWILQSCTQAAANGNSLTVKDLQAKDQFEPTELSRAIGLLKKEGAIQMMAGGAIETTSTPSATTEKIKILLKQLDSSFSELSSCSPDDQRLLKQFSVKR